MPRCGRLEISYISYLVSQQSVLDTDEPLKIREVRAYWDILLMCHGRGNQHAVSNMLVWESELNFKTCAPVIFQIIGRLYTVHLHHGIIICLSPLHDDTGHTPTSSFTLRNLEIS